MNSDFFTQHQDGSAITPENIREMSYTDFVGFVNQWNVLPGAHTTLSEWAVHSRMDSRSRVLEVACTTGYSSRELARITGCSGVGIDISAPSVAMAKYNQGEYAPETALRYECIDGYTFTDPQPFTHIVVGAALKFFPHPQQMMDRCASFFENEGYILASPFYIPTPIPEALVERAKSVFDFTPTQEDYKTVMRLYQSYEIAYEHRQELIPETEEELAYYCRCTIDRAAEMRNITNQSVVEAMYERLYTVKEMSNLLRPYQRYAVLVLRYRKSVYPRRFVELF